MNSKGRIISESLIDNEISHEDFTIIINEKGNCRELKENITMIKSHRSNIERNKLLVDGKWIDTIKIIR